MIGECPSCGAPVEDLSTSTRRDDDVLGDGRVETLMVAEPCSCPVLVRYRADQFSPLDDPELVAP